MNIRTKLFICNVIYIFLIIIASLTNVLPNIIYNFLLLIGLFLIFNGILIVIFKRDVDKFVKIKVRNMLNLVIWMLISI